MFDLLLPLATSFLIFFFHISSIKVHPCEASIRDQSTFFALDLIAFQFGTRPIYNPLQYIRYWTLAKPHWIFPSDRQKICEPTACARLYKNVQFGYSFTRNMYQSE